jgi:hypothetical protein
MVQYRLNVKVVSLQGIAELIVSKLSYASQD